ncbi:hypothetical protein NBRC116494_03200 [Aurantivibrio plasticivorans]
MSFRSKIVISILVLASTVLFTVLWKSLQFFEDRLIAQTQDSNAFIVWHIGSTSGLTALMTKAYGQLQFELQTLVQESDFESLMVVDNNERVVASSQIEQLGQSLTDFELDSTWQTSNITAAGGLVGKILYRYDHSKTQAITGETLRFGSAVALSGLLFVACVAYLIGTMFSRRIESIADSLDAISDGNLEKFNLDTRKDEIGYLSQFVYDMGKKISLQMNELMDVEERMRLALQAAGAGAWKWESDGNTLQWSAKNFQILGYLPGQHKPSFELWLSSVLPEDQDKVRAAVRTMWEEKSELDVEYRIARRLGDIRWMRSVGKMFVDDKEAPKEIYGLQIDITEYKKAAIEIEKQQLLFEAMLNQTNDIVVAIDINAHIITANAATFSRSGMTRDAVIGQPIDALLGEESRKIVRDFIKADIDGDMPSSNVITCRAQVCRASGELVPMTMTVESHLDKELHHVYLLSLR